MNVHGVDKFQCLIRINIILLNVYRVSKFQCSVRINQYNNIIIILYIICNYYYIIGHTIRYTDMVAHPFNNMGQGNASLAYISFPIRQQMQLISHKPPNVLLGGADLDLCHFSSSHDEWWC